MLKESYRINKHSLLSAAKENGLNLRILFTLTPAVYNSYKELDFKTVSGNMVNLLQTLEDKVKQ